MAMASWCAPVELPGSTLTKITCRASPAPTSSPAPLALSRRPLPSMPPPHWPPYFLDIDTPRICSCASIKMTCMPSCLPLSCSFSSSFYQSLFSSHSLPFTGPLNLNRGLNPGSLLLDCRSNRGSSRLLSCPDAVDRRSNFARSKP
jgi:hypothetical protein